MGLDVPFGGREMNAAPARLNISRTINISQINAAAPGLRFHLAAALTDFNPSAAGLDAGSLRGRSNLNTAAAGFRDDFSIGVMYLYGAATGVQTNIAVDGPHVDRSSARLGAGTSANVIEAHAAPTALCLYAASHSAGINVAALRFDLDQSNFARDMDGEFSGKLPRTPTLPVSNDPSRVSAHIGVQLVGVELALGILLG